MKSPVFDYYILIRISESEIIYLIIIAYLDWCIASNVNLLNK